MLGEEMRLLATRGGGEKTLRLVKRRLLIFRLSRSCGRFSGVQRTTAIHRDDSSVDTDADRGHCAIVCGAG
jgi:hypothetical protein